MAIKAYTNNALVNVASSIANKKVPSSSNNAIIKIANDALRIAKSANLPKTVKNNYTYGTGVRPKKLTRAYFVNEDTNDVLLCQFNPESWYTEHGAVYNEIDSPGSNYPKIFYSGRKLEKIPLTVYFYGVTNVVSGKSSTQIENYFEQLTKPAKVQKNFIKGSNHFISPPICTFVFGARCYKTVVENVKILRKMFNNELKTMQLEVSLNLIVIK